MPFFERPFHAPFAVRQGQGSIPGSVAPGSGMRFCQSPESEMIEKTNRPGVTHLQRFSALLRLTRASARLARSRRAVT